MNIVNFSYRNELIKNNETLCYCYQCSTCSSSCPIALATNGRYNPRKIIELGILGLYEKLVKEENSVVWLCSTCQNCIELCPQKVELTEIFTLIKNKCFEEGKVPEAFLAQGKALLENGIAIPYSKAILSRREKLGLPDIKAVPIEELKAIFKETEFEQKILKVRG
ncbi:MAG TPA: 4Fe-4S dicluster domain-containing protein [Candidatus Lokiarchaeia archaeon]